MQEGKEPGSLSFSFYGLVDEMIRSLPERMPMPFVFPKTAACPNENCKELEGTSSRESVEEVVGCWLLRILLDLVSLFGFLVLLLMSTCFISWLWLENHSVSWLSYVSNEVRAQRIRSLSMR